MIAAWASITTGWALTHPVTLIVFGVLAALLALALAVYLLATSESGRHHASRPANPPRRAGKARAWLRTAPRAVRSLPGAITWTWRTPVRTKTLGPGAGLPFLSPVTTATCPSAYSSPKVDSPAPELHHEPTESAMLGWLRTLRGPGWTVLALRRQLAVLGALIASGRAPGHTAPDVHGEPGPAGTTDPGAVATGSSDGPGPSIPEPPAPVISAAPAFLAATPPPHDPALWQPRPAEQTDWSLLAVLAPGLEAERRDAQAQAGGA